MFGNSLMALYLIICLVFLINLMILQIPLFYDSKEVKNTLDEIKNVRDILLFIASQLSNSIEEVEDE